MSPGAPGRGNGSPDGRLRGAPTASVQGTRADGTLPAGPPERIVFEGVSKLYGEILGVNGVNLSLAPGITSLVGPNGSGKTTLMNLLAGLLRPTRGRITVLGVPVTDAERLGRLVGYCTQYDSFPPGMTGWELVYGYLRVGGWPDAEARARAAAAIERVDLAAAAGRKVAAYSKGMRQRIKLAAALGHGPRVLVLDEPLNGLDPMARAEMAALFRSLAADGHFVIISSHILHEVDTLADHVIVIHHGYVMAEGGIPDMRESLDAEHPLGILVRCDQPALLAQRLFAQDHIVEVQIHDDRRGLLVRTRDADAFFRALGDIALDGALDIDSVMPADADVQAVYQYLIGTSGEGL
jgi:ABC-2 type transport system ATP-binding protein